MRGLGLDLRIALRRLRRRPLATAVVLLSLGLAVAGVTAVASVVYGMLLRPLDLHQPERLVRLRENWAESDADPVLRSLHPATYRLWRGRTRALEDLAAAHYVPLSLSRDGLPEQIHGAEVTGNFFEVLGVGAVQGRTLAPRDTAGGQAAPVVVLGHGLWQRRFGGDPGVVERELRIGGMVRRVIGVLPRGFAHPYGAEMWVPMALDAPAADELGNVLYAPARLGPGVSVEQAERELSALTRSLRPEYPLPEGPRGAALVPLREELSRDLDALLLPLFVAAGLVLLIACANVAGLLTAQALEQRRDLALRAALGAGAWQARPFIVQGLLLAIAGGALGAGMAAVVLPPLVAMSPLAGIAISELGTDVELATPVLLFSLAVVLVAGFGLGLAPAAAVARQRPQPLLQEEERGASGGRRFLSLLVAADFALAALLVVGAALVVDGFARARTAERGFDPQNLLVVDLSLAEERLPAADRRLALVRDVLSRVESVPAVSEAAATTVQPLWTGVFSRAFDVAEDPAPDPPGYYGVHHRLITSDYFDAMRIRLLAGRTFHPGESGGDEHSPVIVSRSLAERFWTVDSAVGRRLRAGRLDSEEPWLTVVGVAEDLGVETADAYLNLNDVRFTWYLPLEHEPLDRVSLVLRTRSDPASVADAVRRAIGEVDPQQPVARLDTMEAHLEDFLRRDRFAAVLAGLLAFLGLVLAAAGLYALVAFMTVRGRRDNAVRLAVGARPAQIVAMVLRRTLAVCAAGTVAGLAVSLLTLRTLQSLVPGVDPARPLIWSAVLVGFAAVAVAAAWGPARQVRRIDPADVLRST